MEPRLTGVSFGKVQGEPVVAVLQTDGAEVTYVQYLHPTSFEDLKKQAHDQLDKLLSEHA